MPAENPQGDRRDPNLVALLSVLLVACVPLGVLIWKRVTRDPQATQEPRAKVVSAALAQAPGAEPSPSVNPPVEPLYASAPRRDRPFARTVARPVPKVALQGLSHGRSHNGWLEEGVQLPRHDDLYLRAQPKEQFGTSVVVNHIVQALQDLRTRHRYRGQVVIGDLSLRAGGHFPPHKSHQNGRDVDIWLPVRGSRQSDRPRKLQRPQPDQADWRGTWLLVDALVSTQAVHKIFLSYHLQAQLYEAARRLGVPESKLRAIIQYPNREPHAIVRHSPDHTRHIHVRFRCSMRDQQLGRPPCVE